MTIQSTGSSTAYGSSAISSPGSSSQPSSTDSEIKALQQQKETLEKQIKEIKEGDDDSDTQQMLTKTLENQITEIDAQIQQKQIEKAKTKTDGIGSSQSSSKSDVSSGTSNNDDNCDSVQISGDSVSEDVIKLADTYDKFGKLVSMSNSAKVKAAELNSDAEMLADAGNETGAGKLYAQGAKMSAQADSELSSAAKEAGTAGEDAAEEGSSAGVLTDDAGKENRADDDKSESVSGEDGTRISDSYIGSVENS